MNRVILVVRVLLIALLLSSVLTGSASAGSPSLSPMQAPVKLGFTLIDDEQLRAISDSSPGTRTSNMLGFFPTMVINVKKDGSASGSYRVFSRTSTGILTTTGTFTFGGTYNSQNGRLVGTWVYNGKREGDVDPYDLGTQFYDGSGDLVSTTAIDAAGGKGYLTGELTWTHTECDKQDKDPLSRTFGACLEKNIHSDRENFTVDWVAKPLCGTATTPSCECKVQDSMARFNSLTNRIEVNCNEDETDWEPAYMSQVLYVGDHIKAFQDSSAILQLEDMNTYVLRPETEIVLETPPEKETKIGLVLGRLWCNTKKLLLEGTMEIETTQAVLGIKGTTLVVETDGSITTLKVIAGTVEFRSKTTYQTAMVTAGQQASADDFDLLPVTTFDVQAEQASWAAAAPPAILQPSEGVERLDPSKVATPLPAAKPTLPPASATTAPQGKTAEPPRATTPTPKPQGTASPAPSRGTSGVVMLAAGVVVLAALGAGLFLLRRKA